MRTDTSLVLNLISGMFATIASGGAVYTFSLFAPALRQRPYLYSEAEISTVAAWFVFATFINAPAGAIFDKFGARATLCVACAIMTASWLLISSVILDERLVSDSNRSGNGTERAPSKLRVTFLFALPPFAGSFVEMGAIMGLVSVFKMQQQVVVILCKTVLGLGSAIVAGVYAAWYAPARSTAVNATAQSAATTRAIMKDYSDFAHLMAVYSFVAIGVLAFLIGHGNKRCAGLTIPPASAAKYYKPMIARGETLLYVGIAALTLGNLITVSFSSSSSSETNNNNNNKHDASSQQLGQLMHTVLAVVAIIFPFTFFLLIPALPTEVPTVIHGINNTDDDHHSTAATAGIKNGISDGGERNSPSVAAAAAAAGNASEDDNDFDVVQHSRKRRFGDSRSMMEGARRRQHHFQAQRSGGLSSSPNHDDDDAIANDDKARSSSSSSENSIITMSSNDNNNSSDERRPTRKQRKLASKVALDAAASEAAPNLFEFVRGNNPMSGRVFPDAPAELEDLHDELPMANSNSIWTNIKKRELWQLWFICFCVWGSTSMIYANSSSIYRALPGRASPSAPNNINKSGGSAAAADETTTAAEEVYHYLPFKNSVNAIFVALLSTGNALGRMFAGKAVSALQARGRSSLADLLLIPPIFAALGAAMLLVTDGTDLWLGFAFIGMSVGINWGSLVLVTKRLFTATPGAHYAFLYTAGATTPFVFTMLLFKTVYRAHEDLPVSHHHSSSSSDNSGDETVPNVTLLQQLQQQQQQQHGDGAGGTCHGHKCVQISLFVCIALNFIAYKLACRLVTRIDEGLFDTATQNIPVRDLSHQIADMFFIKEEDEEVRHCLQRHAEKQRREGKHELEGLVAGWDAMKPDEMPSKEGMGQPPEWIQQYINWMPHAEEHVYPKLRFLEEQHWQKMMQQQQQQQLLLQQKQGVAASSSSSSSAVGQKEIGPRSLHSILYQLSAASADDAASASAIRMDNADEKMMDFMTEIKIPNAPGNPSVSSSSSFSFSDSKKE